MVDRIVRQLAQTNENLSENVKTILTKSEVKEQTCHMHEGQSFVTINE